MGRQRHVRFRPQESRASIGGRVTDSSDAAIGGARIQVQNLETGVSIGAVTNDAGVFRVPFLLPGRYKVTGEQPGFKTYSRADLQLRVNDSLDLPIRMELGAVAESVEVRARRWVQPG